MAAIDVVGAAASVADQITAVVSVGTALLSVWVMAWAISTLREMFAVPDGIDVGSVGSPAFGSASLAVVEDAAHRANTAEYDRLASVWQGWQSQIDSAAAQGGVAPAAKQNMAFYDALVARGMDAQDAIAAVESRNAAVDRSISREEAAEQRRVDALADGYDAQEHAAAIERYQSQPVDLTVRLGGGWK